MNKGLAWFRAAGRGAVGGAGNGRRVGNRDGQVFASVYMRLRAFASICEHLGVFSAFCWERATEERLGSRVFNFQLIVLCIEEGGGPGRAESAGGRGAEGWKTGAGGAGRARVESAAGWRGARVGAWLMI